MANNFLNQLQMVVDTGKLLGVTNIKDLYGHFKDSGISYKDFKKQMHDYGIYGHIGRHDMARLSGMYYGSKKADWEAKKPLNLDRIGKRTFAPTFSLNTPNEISPLNIPVTEPVIQKTVVTSAPKELNKSNKLLIAEVTKVVIPANSGDPNTYPTEELVEALNQNLSYDPITGRVRPGGIIGIGSNEHNVLRNSKIGSALKSVFDWAVRNQVTQGGNSAVQIGPTLTADLVRGGWSNFLGWLSTRPGANPSFKNGGNLNKFQQGGKTSSQQDAVMQFVKALAQTLQADPQLVIQVALLNPEALKSAVQVYLETLGDIQKAAQAFSLALQSKAQAAKHGAKLNYFKSLKNKCAEDEELYYFKKGGSISCGCRKKEQGGEMTEEKKDSPILKFKKENKISKHQFGKSLPTAPQVIDAYNGGTYVEDAGLPWLNKILGIKNKTQIIGPRNVLKYPRVLERVIYNNNDTVYNETPAYDPDVVITGPTIRSGKSSDKNKSEYNILKRRFTEGESLLGQPKKYETLKQVVFKKGGELKENKCGGKMKKKACGGIKFKLAKCGSKMKKHQNGGSLNGIPFIKRVQ